MAVRLKIPAVVDKPLLPAETRPQKIAQFIHSLPVSDPLAAAANLLEELENLNRQAVPADARLKALDLYRPTVSNLAEHLASLYCSAALPLPPQAKKAASLAESLWLEMGYGFKLALIDQQSKLFNLASKKSVAFIVHQAIDALNQLAMVYYQTYYPPPASVWGDLHQLYLYAVQESLQKLDVQVNGDSSKPSSIDLVYKQALLMPLADPQHLSPSDIKLVADYIARYAQHAQLQGLGQLENPAGIFIVSLDTDKPPIPYVKNAGQTDADTDILLITVDLARLIHKHLQLLRAGNPPPSTGLPVYANDPRYQDMLAYLIQHWGVSRKRIFNRSRRNDGVELGVGIRAAHYFINGQKHYAIPNDDSSVTEISAHAATSAPTAKKDYRPSHWQVLNISAGGMALRKLPVAEESVRVGELLSVKSEKESRWSVGVLRWANNGEQLEIGAQLIAPDAKPAGAKPVDDKKFEPVLILPGISALKQTSSIVAASGMYRPARVLDLDEGGKISRVMVTKLIERTNSFDRFQFSYL